MADYGLLKVRLSDGRNIKVRGSVTEIISGVSAEAIVNHDGSIDRSFTARAYEFSVSLAARDQSGAPVDAEALIRAAPQDVSLSKNLFMPTFSNSAGMFALSFIAAREEENTQPW